MKIERIRVDKCVYGGEGLGKLRDGRSVFVPYVFPGEEVDIHITQNKKRYAKAVPVQWFSISPDRIQPPCPYFGDCGGCHYQFLRYGDQVELKERILADQFQRLAAIDSVPLRVVELSEKEYHYRNTIQLHVADDGQLGYLRHNTHELVPVDDCLLSKGNIKKFIKQLSLLPEMQINSIQFRWDSNDEVLILMDSDDVVPPEISIDFSASIVHLSPAGELVLAGEGVQVFEINGVSFEVSAQSFFQANTMIAERMVSFVQQHVSNLTNGGVFLDLYSGVGLFTRFLADAFNRCIAIESSPSAMRDFVVNLDQFENIEAYEGLVESILPSLEVNPSVVLMDPPRAGIAATVGDWLAEKQVPLILYVSCDPSTLARDIKRLTKKGYQLQEVALFDQFPQTYHIETISILTL